MGLSLGQMVGELLNRLFEHGNLGLNCCGMALEVAYLQGMSNGQEMESAIF